jgi:hypothetical protein
VVLDVDADETEVDKIGFELDFGIKLDRVVAQQDVLLQLDVDEPDDESDDDDECDDVQSTTVLLELGITIKTAVFTSFVSALLVLLLLAFEFIKGESSMNANVFLRSSNAIYFNRLKNLN